MTLPSLPNRIDTEELTRIKNNFAPRDRVNSEYSSQISSTKSNPLVIFNDLSSSKSLPQGTLLGLAYPLELDNNGGLKLSSGYERIGEQIFEILDTRYGERVYRPFFGTPELLFETISESVLQETLRSQIVSSIPFLESGNVRVQAYMKESGLCEVTVYYSTTGSEQAMVRYQFQV